MIPVIVRASDSRLLNIFISQMLEFSVCREHEFWLRFLSYVTLKMELVARTSRRRVMNLKSLILQNIQY